tara:strand:+ start:130 stop:360 length:231 start_codon:yes stop_codon:yes gene_type:complete
VRDCTKKCIELDVSCPVEDCRQWIDYEEDMNCTLLAVEKHGKMTFREVAKRLGVSFVRIKQIQDKSVASLAKNTLL